MRLTRNTLLLALACLLLVPAGAQAGDGRIINGYENPEGYVVPWQVGLVARDDNNVSTSVFCGGTIRDATHVITAAHCLPDRGAADLAVLAGVADRTTITGEHVYMVDSITSHPGYDNPDQANDIAILKLSRAIEFDHTTKRALPLVESGFNQTNVFALISGWGNIHDDPEVRPESPATVRFTDILIYPDSQCANYAALYRPDSMLCAGFTHPQTNMVFDTCQGDSGGPLALSDGDSDATTWEEYIQNDFVALAGIVSFGKGCAQPGYPGIYAKVGAPELHARLADPSPPPRTEPVVKPSITGEVKATKSITCDAGQWTESPAFTYRWLTAKVEGEGENQQVTDVKEVGQGATYTLSTDDVNRIVVCTVRASGPGGYRTAQSTAIVVEAAPGPTNPGPGPGTNPGPTIPGTQNPGPGTPAPVTPTVPTGPVQPAVPRDLVAPVAGVTRRNCAKRVCKLTIIASDSGGDATGLTATVKRVSGCKKGRKGAKCRKAKTLKVSSKGSGVFEIKTGKLKRARYKFTVVATDAAGNKSKAESVTLKVR